MRLIHLFFELHLPHKIRITEKDGYIVGSYFETKEEFTQLNIEAYQPLFAFLERTTQRYRDFGVSLVVSGLWLELAEKYDPELVNRLKKLVKAGQVELVATPYYYSLAFFYNGDEFLAEVQKTQDEFERLFGVKSKILAMPELIYNDEIGRAAEEAGFIGMIIGEARGLMDWRSANHVYEAEGCRYLRLLVRNAKLSDALELETQEFLTEKKQEDGSVKKVLAAQGFEKRLDLEFLRGGIINWGFQAEIFRRLKNEKIAGFFDELVRDWLKNGNDRFGMATATCAAEEPTMTLSFKQSISQREEEQQEAGLVVQKDCEGQVPRWLARLEQEKLAKLVYGVRKEILSSEDDGLIRDFRRLLAIDYQKGVNSSVLADFEKIIEDLRRRTAEVKKQQVVEISRAYTQRRERNIVRETGDGEIKVNFGKKKSAEPVVSQKAEEAKHKVQKGVVKVAMDPNEPKSVVPVKWVKVEKQEVMSKEVPEEAQGQVAEDSEQLVESSVRPVETSDQPVEAKKKRHTMRKIIRKLVIE